MKDRLILSPQPCSYGWEKSRKERTYETKRTYRESNPVKVRAQAGGWGDKRPPRLAQGSPRTFPGLYFIGFRAAAGVRRCWLIPSICPAPGANKKIFSSLPRRNVREFPAALGGLVLPRWVRRSRATAREGCARWAVPDGQRSRLLDTIETTKAAFAENL